PFQALGQWTLHRRRPWRPGGGEPLRKIAHRIHDPGVDEAGAQDRNADAARSKLQTQALGQGDDAVFRHVVWKAVPRDQPGDRGGGHNVSALAMLLDQWAENRDAPDDGPQVNGDRPIPAGLGPEAIRSYAADARVVHQNVDFAVAGDDGVGCGGELVFQRYVGAHAFDVDVGLLQPLDRLGERLLLDVAEHHLDAGLRERGRDSKPDARRGAGHKGDLASQILHRRLPSKSPILMSYHCGKRVFNESAPLGRRRAALQPLTRNLASCRAPAPGASTRIDGFSNRSSANPSGSL